MLKYLLILLPQILIGQGVSQISGKVINSKTRSAVTEAIIFMPNNAFSTGVNDEGAFMFRYPNIDADSSIIFTCLGCSVIKTTPKELSKLKEVVIELDSLPNIDVSLGLSDAQVLVSAAIDSIPRNYPNGPSAQIGFFRETVSLEKLDYVKISEATIRVERFPEEKDVNSKTKILRSRKFEWEGQSSKIAAFSMGNPTEIVTRSLETAVPDFLTKRKIKGYFLNIDSLMVPFLDKKLYAISFEPKKASLDGGRTGKLYIDPETKAIVRIEYYLTEKGMNQVFQSGLGSIKITGQSVKSINQYFPIGDKWVLGQNSVTFKAKFEDRLDKKFETTANFNLSFHPGYSFNIKRSAIREIEEAMRKEAFGESSSFNQLFWGNENVILPTTKMLEILAKK